MGAIPGHRIVYHGGYTRTSPIMGAIPGYRLSWGLYQDIVYHGGYTRTLPIMGAIPGSSQLINALEIMSHLPVRRHLRPEKRRKFGKSGKGVVATKACYRQGPIGTPCISDVTAKLGVDNGTQDYSKQN